MKNAIYLLLWKGRAVGLFRSYNNISVYTGKSIDYIDEKYKKPTLRFGVFRIEPEEVKFEEKIKYTAL